MCVKGTILSMLGGFPKLMEIKSGLITEKRVCLRYSCSCQTTLVTTVPDSQNVWSGDCCWKHGKHDIIHWVDLHYASGCEHSHLNIIFRTARKMFKITIQLCQCVKGFTKKIH